MKCDLVKNLKNKQDADESRLRLAEAETHSSNLSKAIIHYLNLSFEIRSKKKIKKTISSLMVKKGRWRKSKIQISIDNKNVSFPPKGYIWFENHITINSPSYYLFIRSILDITVKRLIIIIGVESKKTLEFLYEKCWNIENIPIPKNLLLTSGAFQTRKKNQILRNQIENIFLERELPEEFSKYLKIIENEYL